MFVSSDGSRLNKILLLFKRINPLLSNGIFLLSIYRLDYDGNLVGKRLLSFANGTIDESAKLNFVGAEQQGKLTNGMHLLNNPFELPNGICVMEVTDYSNKGAYVVT